MLTPKGMIRSEATIARLAEDRYLLCGPTLADRRDFDWLRRHLPDDGSVDLRFGSPRDAALLVMGPASRELLSRLTDADLTKAAASWMSVAEITVASEAVTALRLSYVGELGWELHVASSGLIMLYQAICDAGAGLGLVDFGSYALNAMRLEKGYHAWGADFGSEYTLFDAGLEGFAKLDKRDFVGRDAVLRQRDIPADWRFAGFVVEGGDADPLPSDPIFQGGRLVGYVTSGGTGFRIGKRLALGYLERAIADPDGGFEIETLGERRRAGISPTPFYDPQNARLRS
jgi:dimethylglycine dehydrogenase